MRHFAIGRQALAVAAALCTHPAAADEVFRDPSGFYIIVVPFGWTVQAQQSGVTLSHELAWASVWHVEGSGPPEGLTEAIASSIAQSWQEFNGASANPCQVSDAEGYCAWFTGVDGRGNEAVLSIQTVASAGHGYALMMSAPRNDFTRLQETFDRISDSFSASLSGE